MSIPALPATFTPASSCLGNTNIWLVYHSNKYNCFSSYTCPYYFLQGPLSTSDCLQPSYEDLEDTFCSSRICPSGYTSACTSTHSLGTHAVTVQICCPTGFVFLLLLIFMIETMLISYRYQWLPMPDQVEPILGNDSALLHSFHDNRSYFCHCNSIEPAN
jgi:hypothetical protein